jgi:hypothetical protein
MLKTKNIVIIIFIVIIIIIITSIIIYSEYNNTDTGMNNGELFTTTNSSPYVCKISIIPYKNVSSITTLPQVIIKDMSGNVIIPISTENTGTLTTGTSYIINIRPSQISTINIIGGNYGMSNLIFYNCNNNGNLINIVQTRLSGNPPESFLYKKGSLLKI